VYKRQYLRSLELINKLTMQNNLTNNNSLAQELMRDLCEENPDLIPKIFYCFLQLMVFSVHKTFYGHIWKNYKEDFMLLRDIFKNQMENGFFYFKQYFGTKIPVIEGSSFNLDRMHYSKIYME
jgi:hypothetical protein